MSSPLLRRTRGVQRLLVCRRPGEHEAAAGSEESNVGDEKRLQAATKCSESKESRVGTLRVTPSRRSNNNKNSRRVSSTQLQAAYSRVRLTGLDGSSGQGQGVGGFPKVCSA